ncbi:3-deoxy-7-phosphoheptulonate synthase [Streptomyces hypolithicus]
MRAEKAGVRALHAGDVGWPTDPVRAGGAPEEPTRSRVAYSIFTSGSTGNPKLVDVGHGEIASFARALRAHGQWPAGLHLELTPDPVTECVSERDEPPRFTDYRSTYDPHLNPEQSAEMVSHFLSLL